MIALVLVLVVGAVALVTLMKRMDSTDVVVPDVAPVVDASVAPAANDTSVAPVITDPVVPAPVVSTSILDTVKTDATDVIDELKAEIAKLIALVKDKTGV